MWLITLGMKKSAAVRATALHRPLTCCSVKVGLALYRNAAQGARDYLKQPERGCMTGAPGRLRREWAVSVG